MAQIHQIHFLHLSTHLRTWQYICHDHFYIKTHLEILDTLLFIGGIHIGSSMTKHLGKVIEKQATGILVSKTMWNHVEFVPANYLIKESSKNINKINISLLQQTCEFRGSTV